MAYKKCFYCQEYTEDDGSGQCKNCGNDISRNNVLYVKNGICENVIDIKASLVCLGISLFSLLINLKFLSIVFLLFMLVFISHIVYVLLNPYKNIGTTQELEHRRKLIQASAKAYASTPVRIQVSNNVPKCPHCSSTKFKKISTVNRATSVAAFGLASGKIGKQYKCSKCGHMW